MLKSATKLCRFSENFAQQINDCNGLEEINQGRNRLEEIWKKSRRNQTMEEIKEFEFLIITYSDDEEPDGALYTKIRDPPGKNYKSTHARKYFYRP